MTPFKFVQEPRYNNSLIEVHISDIHFGAINPKTMYDILKDQFVDTIKRFKAIDIISIDGDLFDRKFLANSNEVFYAGQFIADLIAICRIKGSSLILLGGTNSHDSDQLKLFYPYAKANPDIDMRIILEPTMAYVKGKKYLCLPEVYGYDVKKYHQLLFNSGMYDGVILHGTIAGSIINAKNESINRKREPIFGPNSFAYCQGPIICGHVHVPQCFYGDMYYCGSPIRYQFGEEEEKGFIVLYHNLDSQEYFIARCPIKSFRYDTIVLTDKDLINLDNTLEYINKLKQDGVDRLRVIVTTESKNAEFLKAKFRNTASVVIKEKLAKPIIDNSSSEDIQDLYNKYSYLYDPKKNTYEKFCEYVNMQEGKQFITPDELKKLLDV